MDSLFSPLYGHYLLPYAPCSWVIVMLQIVPVIIILSVIIIVFARKYTDKKGNQNFLIYKEIQSGAVAKSYMTNGLLENISAFHQMYKEALPHI
jgi:hypothetical protein